MSKRSWSEGDLRKAFESSASVRQILKKIGLVPAGGNYSLVKRYLKKMGLDPKTLKGKGWRKGAAEPVTRSKTLKEILVLNSNYQSSRLRQRLIKEKIFEYKCSCCNNTIWLNKPIPLELDHINGIRTDNRLKNLRLVCPNCHAFTPTYRGKNIRGRAGTGIQD